MIQPFQCYHGLTNSFHYFLCWVTCPPSPSPSSSRRPRLPLSRPNPPPLPLTPLPAFLAVGQCMGKRGNPQGGHRGNPQRGIPGKRAGGTPRKPAGGTPRKLAGETPRNGVGVWGALKHFSTLLASAWRLYRIMRFPFIAKTGFRRNAYSVTRSSGIPHGGTPG